jgi:hypothetical protein
MAFKEFAAKIREARLGLGLRSVFFMKKAGASAEAPACLLSILYRTPEIRVGLRWLSR